MDISARIKKLENRLTNARGGHKRVIEAKLGKLKRSVPVVEEVKAAPKKKKKTTKKAAKKD
jgi:hypothetical protein|tara:strand:+ start:137 stop:319 length:183 start_codon:yes stop_codon:yes gene_type:complete